MIRSFLFLLIALSVAGCGGNDIKPTANSDQANIRAANANQPPAANVVASSSNNSANSGENPLTIARNKKIEAMRKAGSASPGGKVDIEAILKQSTRPAPENSEFSVALTDIVVERRVFLRNSVIAKAEKVTDGDKKTLTIFLTDGRSLELPGDSIQSLSTASSASIIKAAGIAMPVRQPSNGKPNAANQK